MPSLDRWSIHQTLCFHSQLFQAMPFASGQPWHLCVTALFNISEALIHVWKRNHEEGRSQNNLHLRLWAELRCWCQRILFVSGHPCSSIKGTQPSSHYRCSHLISLEAHWQKKFKKQSWLYPKHLNQATSSQVGTSASSKKSANDLQKTKSILEKLNWLKSNKQTNKNWSFSFTFCLNQQNSWDCFITAGGIMPVWGKYKILSCLLLSILKAWINLSRKLNKTELRVLSCSPGYVFASKRRKGKKKYFDKKQFTFQ